MEKVSCKLLLIGDGPERWNAESYSRDLGLADHIRFLGKQDAIEEIMAVADLFLLTSEKEAFGLAALEAMACEVPVISTNAGGIPEVNINGVTGYLSEIGDVDAMAHNAISILSNEENLAEFRKNALAQAKRYDINNVLPIYEAYYDQIIQSSLL
jgi:N-acetyl-alpha-D-glucosaminyl L-malate synthase BshA